VKRAAAIASIIGGTLLAITAVVANSYLMMRAIVALANSIRDTLVETVKAMMLPDAPVEQPPPSPAEQMFYTPDNGEGPVAQHPQPRPGWMEGYDPEAEFGRPLE
jgi:hypothetical protein